MNAIGLSLPITRGSAGYFNQTFDTVAQVKANIINLLNTNTGERRMQPLFSNGLRELLFEKNLQNSPEIIKRELEKKINMFIPGVTVENIELNLGQNSPESVVSYTVNVYIKFKINNQSEDLSTQLIIK